MSTANSLERAINLINRIAAIDSVLDHAIGNNRKLIEETRREILSDLSLVIVEELKCTEINKIMPTNYIC
ncbi:hypothetical protein [Photorhabdus khanii]|uniref:Uncharacterized protein n=1 Tax=Photorhabdus khanii subsp. guanajuatensis TaxID=2100166 RepID=A0A4R4IMA0_9GAMM|nr:hypothetical protein [Photorhabdus khanii]TDB41643.1 hypothetical protein C5467_24340 [Photorhabdus khanii subsp. guanajuatensis]